MEMQHNEVEIIEISDRIDKGIVDDSFYSLLPSVIGQVIDNCETTDSQIYKTIIHGLLKRFPSENENWEKQYKELLIEKSNLQKRYEELEEVHQRESTELEKRKFVEECEEKEKSFENVLSKRKEKIKRNTPDIYGLIQDKKFGPQIQKAFIDRLSNEIFDFFVDHKKYIEIEDPKIRESEAKRIYEKYIKNDAPEQVNIPTWMIVNITKAIENNIFMRSLFQDVACELENSVEHNYKTGDDFQEIIKKRGFTKFVSVTGTINECNIA